MASKEQKKLLYLFGDQTFALQPHLRLLRGQMDTHPIMMSFIEQAYHTIVKEIHRLPEVWKDELLGRVTNIADILNWDLSEDKPRSIAMEMAMVCLFQISTFLLAQKDSPCWSGEEQDQVRVLGFCTGALAAAAVSCCSTVSDLIPLALEAVGLAFRTGARVSEVSLHDDDALSPDGREDQWAMAVLGPDAAGVVESYCDSQHWQQLDIPHITAYTPRGVTVSGVPFELMRLRDSGVLQGFEIKELPLYGLFHAPQLFSHKDVERLALDIDHNLAVRRSIVPVMSGVGEVKSDSFQALLESALMQILLEPLRWVKVLELVRTWCVESTEQSSNQAARLFITAVGSKAGHLLLKQTSLDCSLVDLPGEEKGV